MRRGAARPGATGAAALAAWPAKVSDRNGGTVALRPATNGEACRRTWLIRASGGRERRSGARCARGGLTLGFVGRSCLCVAVWADDGMNSLVRPSVFDSESRTKNLLNGSYRRVLLPLLTVSSTSSACSSRGSS
jgi:hypothetical protein